jgi:hypothetical protein
MTTTASEHDGRAPKLTTGLGYFSLGLGAAQLLAPGRVNRLIGVHDDAESRFWQRLVGAQELSAAAGILTQRRPLEWLWGRTAADVLHLTMLTRARRRAMSSSRLAGTAAWVLGTFAADAYASVRMTADRQAIREGSSVHAKASITVGQAKEDVQRGWREFAGPTDPRTVAVFVDAPGGRGTEIHLDLEYDVPGGAVGSAVKKVAGSDPLQRARDDLRRFKQLAETGEVVRSDGAPTGHSAKLQPKQRPAQPVEHANA